MTRELHDHFFQKAKREGYLSRAAFKLSEIDDKRKVLAKGDAVLDCGCAPGSWIQVAAPRVGKRGVVVAIDLKPVEHNFGNDRHTRQNAATIHLIEGDITATDPAELTGLLPKKKSKFDVILSDMAPNTTGDRSVDHHRSIRLCHTVLDLASEFLAPGGSLVMKVLEGETYPDLLARAADMFERAKGFKPKASRDVSTEMFVIAQNFAPNAGAGDQSAGDADASPESRVAPPKPPKPAGWGSG